MVIHRNSNKQQVPAPYKQKRGRSGKVIGNMIGRVLLALLLILLLLAVSGTAAHAAGLVDDTCLLYTSRRKGHLTGTVQ